MDDFTYSGAQLTAGDANYWAAKPAPVQELQKFAGNSTERVTLAQKLALQGYIIDAEIDVEGYNALWAMASRKFIAPMRPWVPNILQPQINLFIPGLNNPPFSPYDGSKPPVGAILTVLPSDQPPTPPPPPTPGHELVGPVANAFGMYPSDHGVIITPAGANVPEGVFVAADRTTITPTATPGGYVGHLYPTLVGNYQMLFTKTP